MSTQNGNPVTSGKEAEFSRPVESIMRCEDFKSNFARRLSNRYISRSPISTPKQDSALKLHPENNQSNNIVPERIEPCSQLSKSVTMVQNGEVVKPPDKPNPKDSDIRTTEVTALNMEVDTLRWQLAQTETNRQMHIALLRQIVTFLNRVKDHIEDQKPIPEPIKETLSTRMLPRSFNLADLPRSRSVLHVNKNLEYTLNPPKKINSRKISKSISNVNGFKDCSGLWSQSKLSLNSETDVSQKLSEEMTRLITLANTVLSTNLPDLACNCTDSLNELNVSDDITKQNIKQQNDSSLSLNLIEEAATNAFILNTICDSNDVYESINNKFIELKNGNLDEYILSPTLLNCGLETDFSEIKVSGNVSTLPCNKITDSPNKRTKGSNEKRNEFNQVSSFIEDESGFSSMSSFQEIGIPIISIIPPSPCKEVGYMEENSDIIENTEKWKTDTIGLDKQTVKVFWV